ncbi:Synapse-associated protein 1 [Chytridiales sp. JEL 0842]|nr:Synapse-associated protein 1 [Chytridiales sp. JEL 0842]
MQIVVLSFASDLASKVQKAVVEAAQDFDSQQQKFAEAKREETGGIDKEEDLALPRLSVPNLVKADSLLSVAKAVLSPLSPKEDGLPRCEADKLMEEDGLLPASAEGESVGSQSNRIVAKESTPPQEKDVRRQSDAGQSSVDSLELPWQGVPDEEGLKQQILKLSSEPRNFLMDPPENTDFTFSMPASSALALGLLNLDPNLQKMRYDLVPKKIKEPIFWRNYFYRLTLAKNSAALLQPPPSSSSPSGVNPTPLSTTSTCVELPLVSPTPLKPVQEGSVPVLVTDKFETAPLEVLDTLPTAEALKQLVLNENEEVEFDTDNLLTDEGLPDDGTFGSDWEKEMQEELGESL